MDTRIRKAVKSDTPIIEGIALASYHKYIEIIGKKPAPMVADFAGHLERDIVFVAVEEGTDKPVGYAVIIIKDHEYWLENIAVHPAVSGRGVGSQLIGYVEDFISARADHYQLYTHIKMTDNIGWYNRTGFTEVKRSVEDGFERVFFLKHLR